LTFEVAEGNQLRRPFPGFFFAAGSAIIAVLYTNLSFSITKMSFLRIALGFFVSRNFDDCGLSVCTALLIGAMSGGPPIRIIITFADPRSNRMPMNQFAAVKRQRFRILIIKTRGHAD
jgi:hypothetical protein